MSEQPDEEKFADLADVYGLLKRDAKDMLQDLLDGVSLWRSTSRILFGYALTSILLGVVFIWGAFTSGTPLGIGLGLIALLLYGLAAVTLLVGFRYHMRYVRLTERYSKLYESAKKLA